MSKTGRFVPKATIRRRRDERKVHAALILTGKHSTRDLQKKEPFTMSSTEREITRSAKMCLGFGLLACCLAAAPAALAQYPTKSQVGKDGTAVLIEDYA